MTFPFAGGKREALSLIVSALRVPTSFEPVFARALKARMDRASKKEDIMTDLRTHFQAVTFYAERNRLAFLLFAIAILDDEDRRREEKRRRRLQRRLGKQKAPGKPFSPRCPM